MYLTRMRLDVSKRDTMRALAEPKLFHGAIERSFAGERRRHLWRIDALAGAQYLMLLSEERPNLDAAVQQFGCPELPSPWETRDYAPLLARIAPDTTWQFRLTANPTKRAPGNVATATRGKVLPHITAEHQEQWLLEKAPKHGFALTKGQFMPVQEQWYQFRKPQEGNRPVSLLSVTFEGRLTVTDAELFRRTLMEGIGRAKAYGMGMLTVVRAVDAP